MTSFVNILNGYKFSYQKDFNDFVDQIEPAVKQVYTTIAEFFKSFLDSIIDVVAHFAAIVTDFYEKHKPELEELTNTFTAIFKGELFDDF